MKGRGMGRVRGRVRGRDRGRVRSRGRGRVRGSPYLVAGEMGRRLLVSLWLSARSCTG